MKRTVSGSAQNYHTPAKYKLIYSPHYNNPTLNLEFFWGSSCRNCLYVTSDDRRHCFSCCCNVFGHIISPQSGISFANLTAFPLAMGVSCGSRRSENTVLSFFIYMTTSILYQASLVWASLLTKPVSLHIGWVCFRKTLRWQEQTVLHHVGFSCFMGTFHRHNDFYHLQTLHSVP